MTDSSVKLTLPAGTYWIGDPGYILSEEQYEQWLQEIEKGNEYDAVVIMNGYSFVTLSTMLGDGYYKSNLRFKFGVDSGNLACIPIGIVKQPPHKHFVRRRTFKKAFKCFRTKKGMVHFGSVMIDTYPWQ